ncbi:uncharacterized protein LOC123663698 [Melitaea cinxia]|uniref:uncharacterized protein LOC123663698 n=1 Tax=Melitaea cinxia TaxID=113334 RepID=UPI001E271B4B|nr:uncharacterized protein LOC123663698 [Melitaea cinxia]
MLYIIFYFLFRYKMRIKGFWEMIIKHYKSYTLNNTTVVIDGHFLFYTMYRSSGLQYVLGPESDRFAKYIKKYFEVFKKANVKCLIVFKGGHENEEMLYRGGVKRTLPRANGFILGGDYGNRINPILAKDIFLQSLSEMNFKCIVCCRNDIVEECSALAREFSCPVISYNIKYCFLADTYISYNPTRNFISDKNGNFELQIFTQPKSNSVVNFINENEFQIKDKDPLWFEKGVYLRFIDIDYIDLYYYKIGKGSHLIEDFEADSSCLICVDVIKYAYDLLTNFKGDVITFWDDNSLQYELSIKKPEYVADFCVFENGWNNVKVLLLFEHFLVETLQSFHFEALERAPADSRMLLIVLVFFTRKKVGNFQAEIYSIILSYVMLNVVANKVNIELISNVPEITQKPSLDFTTDKDSVLIEDCKVAAALTRKYFEVSFRELHYIFDPKIAHPLVEFERCLKELNSLNKLCGSSYDATVYSRTYNGTFVYKILLDIKESGDAKAFITNLLNPAATVLAFVEGMIGVYNRILYEF